MTFSTLQWIRITFLVCVTSKENRWHAKLYAFANQLISGVPCMYACMQIGEVVVPFTTTVGS